MSIKLIAIGNRKMCDEGIAVKIAEKLKDEFYSENIEVILGDADKDIDFHELKGTELFFILDVTCYNINPGTITLFSAGKYNLYFNNFITNSHISLIEEIGNSTGYIIGIEIDEITFDTNLSKALEDKFITISNRIKAAVKLLKHCSSSTDINIIQNKINCLI